MKIKRTTRNDLIFISLIFVASAVILFLQAGNRTSGSYAVVSVDGVETDCIDLSEDGNYTLNGGTNVLSVKDNSAFMSYASCPDCLCVKQGTVKYNGQCITCLPNRLTVTVKNKNSYADIII